MTSFVRVGFWVFDGLLTNNWNWQHGNSVRLKHSPNFLDCFPVLANVLQDMGGKDKVISSILKREPSNIYVVIYPFCKQIGSLVATKSSREQRAEELFGCEVEHIDVAIQAAEDIHQR